MKIKTFNVVEENITSCGQNSVETTTITAYDTKSEAKECFIQKLNIYLAENDFSDIERTDIILEAGENFEFEDTENFTKIKMVESNS